jgi:preprotein translocase subunit Sec61beta
VTLKLDPKKALGIALTAIVLLLAVWLVSPFFHLTAKTEANGRINGYRLFLGLTIMIGFVGKSLWDVLAPQGLAKKVSNTKAIAIVGLAIVVMGFVVFTVARAISVFLNSSIAADASNFLP